MSRKHRLINRKSYFNPHYNRECLNEYRRDFISGKLNDIEVFEITVMFIFEKHFYNGLVYKEVLETFNDTDSDTIMCWLFEDLTTTERSRIISAVVKIYHNLKGKRSLDELEDYEFYAVKKLLEISQGDEDA